MSRKNSLPCFFCATRCSDERRGAYAREVWRAMGAECVAPECELWTERTWVTRRDRRHGRIERRRGGHGRDKG